MIFIKFNKVYLDIPIIDASRRIFKKNTKVDFSDQLIGSKRLNSDKKIFSRILDNINFEVNEGDSIALIGHNGSGKTTLLRLIAGIYKQTSGDIKYSGIISAILNIGAVLSLEATGYQNITIITNYLKQFDINEEKLHKYIREVSGLGDFLNMPIKNYSSGMQARLIFSITLYLKTDIAIVDEGISTGDEQFRTTAHGLLEEHLSSIKIKFFASHDENFLRQNCNRAFVMKKGNLRIFENVDDGFKFYYSNEYKEIN